ncbi:MAG: CrcB protein [Halieaceae bacterium]|jgi:CrcB protein
MKHILFIALGGAGGAVGRYLVTNAIHTLAPGKFPWATLSVNFAGSFCIGIMYVLIAERAAIHSDWRNIVIVGFLGAFTTFSTFSLETFNLIEDGQMVMAVFYTLGSVIICVLAAGLGVGLTRLA